MADWQQYLQSLLFSTILTFHDTRSHQTEAESKPEPDEKSYGSPEMEEIEPSACGSLISDHSDSDDDWEGVESTELGEKFSAATADRAAEKASNEVQLQLYGLYKIATEGRC